MEGEVGPVTVVIVDDHTLVRDGVRSLLSAEPGIEVVAEGADGQAAVALAEQYQPDVLLLDSDLPGPLASVTVPRVRAVSPATRVIVLAGDGDPIVARVVMGLGPTLRGYVVKDASVEQLIGAIHTVMHDDGRTAVAGSRASLDGALEQVSLAEQAPVLSERERQVLQLAAQGYTSRDIAGSLYVSEPTVRRHLATVYQKLHATGRVDAINRATAAGLIYAPAPGQRPEAQGPTGPTEPQGGDAEVH